MASDTRRPSSAGRHRRSDSPSPQSNKRKMDQEVDVPQKWLGLNETLNAAAQAKNAKLNDFVRDKSKSSIVRANKLKIGTWEMTSQMELGLVAKFYYNKRRVVYEISENGLKKKMEIPWSDISAIKANFCSEHPDELYMEVKQPPTFSEEYNLRPRKHTNWRPGFDFTQGQAQSNGRHYLEFLEGTLGKHYEKLLFQDKELHILSQKPFPSHAPPLMFPTIVNKNRGLNIPILDLAPMFINQFTGSSMQYPSHINHLADRSIRDSSSRPLDMRQLVEQPIDPNPPDRFQLPLGSMKQNISLDGVSELPINIVHPPYGRNQRLAYQPNDNIVFDGGNSTCAQKTEREDRFPCEGYEPQGHLGGEMKHQVAPLPLIVHTNHAPAPCFLPQQVYTNSSTPRMKGLEHDNGGAWCKSQPINMLQSISQPVVINYSSTHFELPLSPIQANSISIVNEHSKTIEQYARIPRLEKQSQDTTFTGGNSGLPHNFGRQDQFLGEGFEWQEIFGEDDTFTCGNTGLPHDFGRQGQFLGEGLESQGSFGANPKVVNASEKHLLDKPHDQEVFLTEEMNLDQYAEAPSLTHGFQSSLSQGVVNTCVGSVEGDNAGSPTLVSWELLLSDPSEDLLSSADSVLLFEIIKSMESVIGQKAPSPTLSGRKSEEHSKDLQ